ncbi:hypothetical protein SARC_10803 [Sphaeroforma arctica JP610]|uniref:L-serine ammonia-lyase n=1 Tax=Sphaeroforma arctica JP610 TaxID=667725 RepID=A0A0L0FIY1_9EUKA|nr:hypothetical protein SARC_10803 [Sphaeroforma arctica JP610]KNC76710.1 hypothetical protein SARC_10803 [Sphaeroforma arctica JP610]|eukprot:XP_014150612.1 hypothetical protein SARC_10803 [Sphaeroforma arctica JP610]
MVKQPLHLCTPLLLSSTLSGRCQRDVYLKLECVQPGGSFKVRGLGRMIQKAQSKGFSKIVCSSGGNAGMAAAYCGKSLEMQTYIFVPSTTPKYMRDRLQAIGAEVVVAGDVWEEADLKARQMVDAAPTRALYVPPFDHADIWEGHGTVVHEIKQQLPQGVVPAAVVVSVGGGGLFNGVAQGLESSDWSHVPIVAVETKGAESFNAMTKARALVRIPAITSLAKSLGANCVSQRSLDIVLSGRPVKSMVVSDRQAVLAVESFLNDERLLVEPACGASLTIAYNESLLTEAMKDNTSTGPIVIIVCGGNAVTLDALRTWLDTTA